MANYEAENLSFKIHSEKSAKKQKSFLGLRVKQPEELMGKPTFIEEDFMEPRDAQLIQNSRSKFGQTVTAQQLNQAWENLQITVENKNKFEDESKSNLQQNFPFKKFAPTIHTLSPPGQTSSTTASQTVSCIIWVHLQASICTEWEQNSMILTPGTNTGAKVTTINPAPIVDANQEVTPQMATSLPTLLQALSSPSNSSGQKKPKTIHRCILQRTSKSKSVGSSLTCHVCYASYETYLDYYNHLIERVCEKNKAARTLAKSTSPTIAKAESKIESKILRKILPRSQSISSPDDDEEIQIEAEFLKDSTLSLRKSETSSFTNTTITSSISSITTTTTSTATTTTAISLMSSSPSQSISNSSFSPTVQRQKRNRIPTRLNLSALSPTNPQNPSNQSSPSILSKRSYASFSSYDQNAGPLNLSKRPSLQQITTPDYPSDLPPLVPIKPLQDDYSLIRDTLGSTGSDTQSSSSETSPNGNDVFAEQARIFPDSIEIYGNRNGNMIVGKLLEDYSDKGKHFVNFEERDHVTLIATKKRKSFNGVISDADRKDSILTIRKSISQLSVASPPSRRSIIREPNFCPHALTVNMTPLSLTDHANDQSLISNLKVQLTKLLVAMFGEDKLCNELNYPDTDILTILQNIINISNHDRAIQVSDGCTELCQQQALSLNQTQLRFRLLRREIFVARSNISKLLKTYLADRWEQNHWDKKPIEAILGEILSVEITN